MTELKTPEDEDWSSSIPVGLSGIVGRGGLVAFGVLTVFGLWAAFVPLGSAVVAPGSLEAKGQNKVLQHRTGGVVREIFAVEGDVLKAGERIAVLDPAVDRAQLSRLQAQYAKALAMQARLEAEKGFSNRVAAAETTRLRGSMIAGIDNEAITSSFEIDLGGREKIDTDLAREQQREFEKGRQALLAEVQALQQRAEGFERQRTGLADREIRVRQQVELLAEQKAALVDLVRADHISKQQLWDVEARLLERQAELDQVRSQHEALASQIAETEAQIDQARSVDARRTSEALTEVLADIGELRDQVRAAETALTDTIVRAPVDGTLTHSKLTTVGGVVPPGETFGEIVPKGAELEVVARVAPQSISEVQVGQDAKMTITALNSRLYDALPAKVVYVAADSTLDQRTGEHYFEVRARLEPFKDSPELNTMLTPGMNGHVSLEGPSRTFLSYLMRPLEDSFSRAFKEQR